MSTDQADDHLLPATLQAMLEEVHRASFQLPPDEQDSFAFNVFVNGLSSVLEQIRARKPRQYRAHLEMALLMLQSENGSGPHS